jgi:hypothetical protein
MLRCPELVSITLALAFVVQAPRAGAEPSAAELREARESFAQAERSEKAGDWAGALERLRRVERIKETPGILFHIALCEENLGELVQALEDYARAERQATEEKNREVLGALKEPMAALRERIPHLLLRVPPDVKGLEVTLDGKPLPPAYYNAEIPVNPRSHRVEARAPGQTTFSRTFDAKERETTTLDVLMGTSPAAMKEAPRPVIESPDTGAAANSRPASEERRGTTSAGTIVAASGAVGFAGFGILAFVLAGNKADSTREQCASQPTCDNQRTSIRTLDALALGSWIAAGALGTVSVVMWLAPEPGAHGHASTVRRDRLAPRARLLVGPAAAGVYGQF